MNLQEAVAARRSVRAFSDRPVPAGAIDRAVALAIQAPAPHHSSPWRFVILSDPRAKEAVSAEMGRAWREDLRSDGIEDDKIETILTRSHSMLTSTPTLVFCCADHSRAHRYPDERRRRAEWSLFAHSMGAALQTFMLSLATEGISSCWISAPVFCGEVLRRHLRLGSHVEPHALILTGYADPAYRPRPRPSPDVSDFILTPGSLPDRE